MHLQSRFTFCQATAFTLLYCMVWSISLQAQVLQTSDVFAAATPFLEPDGRKLCTKTTGDYFVTLSKVKGGIGGPTDYKLEKYDRSLKKYFGTSITVPESEEIMQVYYNGKDIIILASQQQEDKKACSLKATYVDVDGGNVRSEKTLHEFKVRHWMPGATKGAVKQTMEELASVVTGQGFTSSPECSFKLAFSPDSNRILSYIYDYSQPQLFAHACIFDRDLNKLDEGNIPIDNGFINYGLGINNAGEVVILNGDRLGTIVLVEYDLASHQSKLLEIPYASAHRQSLHMQIISDDVVCVANTVISSKGKLLAVMHSTFNFKAHEVQKVEYHPIESGLQDKANASRLTSKLHGEESWQNFEITRFEIDQQGRITMALEKRELQSPEFPYDPGSTVNPEKWHEGSGKIYAESMLIVGFDSAGKMVFETYHPKHQTAEVSSGLNCASFAWDVATSGKIRLLFTTADNASGIFNTLHYLEYNAGDGTLKKEVKLNNPEGIGLMRQYSLWWHNGLILCGRKGLLGKKSYICSYQLD